MLVTGAGSGIGKHLVICLAERGVPVFAGARKAEHLEMLGGMHGVTAVQLDVTRPEEVTATATAIRDSGHGLYGVVNNAGLGGLGPLVSWSEAEFQEMLNVNVHGPWRVTNACLPQLLESRGRVVNIGSQGGLIAMGYYGPYTMTKHALEAYTLALRDELEPHGVRVSIVEPGGIVSEIGEKALDGTLARLARAPEPFAEATHQLAEALQAPLPPPNNEPESATNRKPSSPEIVWHAVEHALYAPEPKRAYLVGTRWEGDRVLKALALRMAEANDSPSHGLPLEELLGIVRTQWAARTKDGS